MKYIPIIYLFKLKNISGKGRKKEEAPNKRNKIFALTRSRSLGQNECENTRWKRKQVSGWTANRSSSSRSSATMTGVVRLEYDVHTSQTCVIHNVVVRQCFSHIVIIAAQNVLCILCRKFRTISIYILFSFAFAKNFLTAIWWPCK